MQKVYYKDIISKIYHKPLQLTWIHPLKGSNDSYLAWLNLHACDEEINKKVKENTTVLRLSHGFIFSYLPADVLIYFYSTSSHIKQIHLNILI